MSFSKLSLAAKAIWSQAFSCRKPKHIQLRSVVGTLGREGLLSLELAMP